VGLVVAVVEVEGRLNVGQTIGELFRDIAVRVSPGDGRESLLEKLPHAMADLARLSTIAQGLGARVARFELLFARPEQPNSAIGAAVLPIEVGHDGLRNQVEKDDSLFARIIDHEAALVGLKSASQHVSAAMGAFFNSRSRFFHK